MATEAIQELVDSALLSGMVEAECTECGMTIQCETDASRSWCGVCNKVVRVKNPLIELGFK